MWKINDTYLAHHGIKGQKWGVRRYRNPDGTLTEEGKRRYTYLGDDHTPELTRKGEKLYQKELKAYKKNTKAKAHIKEALSSSKNVSKNIRSLINLELRAEESRSYAGWKAYREGLRRAESAAKRIVDDVLKQEGVANTIFKPDKANYEMSIGMSIVYDFLDGRL